jgi:hypothetical protein
MATTIVTKNSATAGSAPSAGALSQGELAVNVADKRLYTKDSGGSVVEVGTNPGGVVTFTAGSASAPAITTTGDTNTGIFFPAADTIAFAEGGTESMRIDSSGNLGIGVTPSGNYTLQSANNFTAGFKGFKLGSFAGGASGSGFPWAGYNIRPTGTLDSYLYDQTDPASALKFSNGINFYLAPSGTAGNAITFTQAMTLDASGNLGLGVTPSAWGGTGVRAFQISGFGSFAGGSGSVDIYNNTYYDGNNFRYISGSSLPATRYAQITASGEHQWYRAPSGTAGNVITFTQAMTLDASGNLGIGTTSPGARLDVNSTASTLRIRSTSSTSTDEPKLTFFHDGNDLFTVQGGVDLKFLSNGGTTERMRITNSGNLLVGTTSSSDRKLFIKGSSPNNTYFTSFENDNASTPVGIDIRYPSVDPNNSGSQFLDCRGVGTLRLQIRSNGGIANYSANNVNLSDSREKTNVELAGSYLDKICAIPVKTFNYIDQNFEEDDGLTLGVIAQDVQAIAPELVMESNWAGKDEPEKMRLSIYQTDLQYALMKAIQEQQAIITDLKARIEALENK